MNSPAIDRVVEVLGAAGYRRLTKPLEISTIRFEFPAALVGKGRVPDLIVVVDTNRESAVRIRQKVEALSRALDVAESRRPLTAILVGPRLGPSITQRIARSCRVLVIEEKSESDIGEQIQESLAVLLPLSLPTRTSSLADPFGELSKTFPNVRTDPVLKTFETAAKRGAAEVTQELRILIAKPVQSLGTRRHAN